jgi:hypothetical protein
MAEASVSPPQGERRASIRYYFRASQPAASLTEDRWPARIRDISATGIGLICHRSFDPGRLIKIELQLPGTEQTRLLSACVVRSVPQSDGTWLVGAAFTEPLSPGELQQLVA